jgi:hypothetical protein
LIDGLAKGTTIYDHQYSSARISAQQPGAGSQSPRCSLIIDAAKAARVENEVARKDSNRPLLAPQRHKPDRELVATLLAQRLNELPPDSIRRRAIFQMFGHGEVSS